MATKKETENQLIKALVYLKNRIGQNYVKDRFMDVYYGGDSHDIETRADFTDLNQILDQIITLYALLSFKNEQDITKQLPKRSAVSYIKAVGSGENDFQRILRAIDWKTFLMNRTEILTAIHEQLLNVIKEFTERSNIIEHGKRSDGKHFVGENKANYKLGDDDYLKISLEHLDLIAHCDPMITDTVPLLKFFDAVMGLNASYYLALPRYANNSDYNKVIAPYLKEKMNELLEPRFSPQNDKGKKLWLVKLDRITRFIGESLSAGEQEKLKSAVFAEGMRTVLTDNIDTLHSLAEIFKDELTARNIPVKNIEDEYEMVEEEPIILSAEPAEKYIEMERSPRPRK